MGGKQAKIQSLTNGSSKNYLNNSKDEQFIFHDNNNSKHKLAAGAAAIATATTTSNTTNSTTSASSYSLKNASPLNTLQLSPIINNGALVLSQQQYQQNHQQLNKVASPFKRFGISPRFKRKIVEVISRTANRNDAKQKIFSSNKLYNAFQSQLNLFQSFQSLNSNSKYNLQQSSRLSISLERNSFRYQSRRKYKTQSLANPFRHANTNYPVYIHEALFLPEFSVKGKVTEADFEIIDVISRGAFGHVIKVKHKDDDKLYAMKIMWKSQVIRDRALQQVKDEVTIACSCSDNPFIVKTWFYWQSKRFLYIITSFIENGELLSLWLKVHHFPERVVCVYIIEMSLVLDYLHNKGIIYRDIKMENILLDSRGHVQLIDFGLSKWLKMGDKTSTICGTIQYMGPEVLSVEPYTHAVDWWSLGILMYALLTGEYPINAAKDHIQMSDRVQKHQFELDSNKYSLSSCELISKLLCKNPMKRLKCLSDLKNEKFFSNEIKSFYKVNNCLNADFWNSTTILDYYSPFQLLFDELNNIRNLKHSQRHEIHYVDDNFEEEFYDNDQLSDRISSFNNKNNNTNEAVNTKQQRNHHHHDEQDECFDLNESQEHDEYIYHNLNNNNIENGHVNEEFKNF